MADQRQDNGKTDITGSQANTCRDQDYGRLKYYPYKVAGNGYDADLPTDKKARFFAGKF